MAVYTYDAWNRLVKVKYNTSERSKYVYNGLNWRIVKHADTSMPPDGDLNEQSDWRCGVAVRKRRRYWPRTS